MTIASVICVFLCISVFVLCVQCDPRYTAHGHCLCPSLCPAYRISITHSTPFLNLQFIIPWYVASLRNVQCTRKLKIFQVVADHPFANSQKKTVFLFVFVFYFFEWSVIYLFFSVCFAKCCTESKDADQQIGIAVLYVRAAAAYEQWSRSVILWDRLGSTDQRIHQTTEDLEGPDKPIHRASSHRATGNLGRYAGSHMGKSTRPI